MQTVDALHDAFRQHDRLPIRIVSPDFGHLSPEIAAQYGLTHRRPDYFFLFMLQGCTRHVVKGLYTRSAGHCLGFSPG